MLADTVEAACRSLENPTEERLDKFIQKLLTDKMEHGQLDNCDLTFCDLNKIKLSFVKFLVGFYHNRVKYPNQKDPDEIQKKEEVVEDKQDEKDSVLGDKTLNEVKLNG